MDITSTKLHRGKSRANDPLLTIAERLAVRIPTIGRNEVLQVAHALHEILDGADDLSREARTQVQMHLVRISSEHQMAVGTREAREEMITTEQAAHLMGCSRPYVAMLVDDKRLAGATKSSGGHRKIPLSSVRSWMIEHPPVERIDADYRAAAAAAGMYDIPEEDYIAAAKKDQRKRRD